MDKSEDAYGHEVYDYFRGKKGVQEIIERSDKYIDVSNGPAVYFAPFAVWPAVEREAVQYAGGRILDVGCGPGRAALYFQKQGHEVVGIDNSPLAIEVARERGVADARVLSVTQVSGNKLGQFNTIVMFGNNFGLMGNRRRAYWLLRRFANMTGENGRILATSLNPYDTENPAHRAYHRQNRERGRMGGQVRIRVRYRKIVGPWFDYLLVSPEEMAALAAESGWRVARFIQDEGRFYVGVLEKS